MRLTLEESSQLDELALDARSAAYSSRADVD